MIEQRLRQLLYRGPDTAKMPPDRQLESAAAEVADRPELYTPPMPVPLTPRPTQPKPGDRAIASTVWLVNSPAAFPGFGTRLGRGSAQDGMSFPVMSILVDNLTAGFLFWSEVGVWVPPFNYGRIFRYDGSYKAYVRWETPPGLTAVPAANANQMARVVFSAEVLDEVVGQVLPAADR